MMLPESISPELRAYLADWLAWTERGGPEGKPYSRRYGVRGEIYQYPGKRLFREMDSLFREQFAASYLFPFGGQRRFTDDYMNSTMHENPERLAWVRMMLRTYDESGQQRTNIGVALRQDREDAAMSKCRHCGVEMTSGVAIEQTYVSGSPDFPGDTHAVTFSAGGPGRLIACWKCPSCGFSATTGPSRDAKVLQPEGRKR